MHEAQPPSKLKRSIFALVLLVIFPLAALVVVEGSVSLLMFGRDYRNQQAPRVMRPHTVHDTLLGWVNRPGFSGPDEYGKGVGLTTNALGFRGSATVAPSDSTTPRLVCLGDGVTLGYGVADQNSWCDLLGSHFPGLQTVNMGQNSYGVDQSFLWYRRDGVAVPHHVTLLAVTYGALQRATSDNVMGRFKPTLTADGGTIRVANVPVPQESADELRQAYAGRLVNNLRIVQLFRRFPSFEGTSSDVEKIGDRWPTLEQMFSELQTLDKNAGRELVIVYLPTRPDVNTGPIDEIRTRLAAFADRQHIRYFDLTPAVRAMRGDSLDLAFITKAAGSSAPAAIGFYTTMANAWAAREIAARLRDLAVLAPMAAVAAPTATSGKQP